MEEDNKVINPDEKLTASTSMTAYNYSDISIKVESWTCGFGFLIDTVSLDPDKSGSVKAEYVWYDFRAKDIHDNVIAEYKGIYYNKDVIVIGKNGAYRFAVSKKK